MFSGIVVRVGTVERVWSAPGGTGLAIRSGFESDPEPGASVAVNGVCLTVERVRDGLFEATAVPETVARTTLGTLAAGSRVNLERALRVGDELGGHWVQGHVDAVATVVSVEREKDGVRVGIETPEALRHLVAMKGSVAVDGVSLTVAGRNDTRFEVALIPYTLEHTIAGDYAKGTRVNLEADLIARYLERLLAAEAPAR
ncbi:MAG TPA: riboflavin synthase [Candidatus Omnitrophota bacterium]|jgi:riboflavin synthase|nr:riboflavin synthase [Candidatus Omnitrophota bacterium]